MLENGMYWPPPFDKHHLRDIWRPQAPLLLAQNEEYLKKEKIVDCGSEATLSVLGQRGWLRRKDGDRVHKTGSADQINNRCIFTQHPNIP